MAERNKRSPKSARPPRPPRAPRASKVPKEQREHKEQQEQKEKEWWVEEQKSRERPQPSERQSPVGASFFTTVEDYDQVQAEKNLTDLNPKLLAEADPAPGEWGYIALLEKKSPQRAIDKVKRAMPLPRNARGVIVDSGLSLRAIVEDTQELGILMEFNFIEEASFDCWIQNEWVSEQVFKGKNELLKRSERLLRKYLRRGANAVEEFFDAPSPTGALPPARTEW